MRRRGWPCSRGAPQRSRRRRGAQSRPGAQTDTIRRRLSSHKKKAAPTTPVTSPTGKGPTVVDRLAVRGEPLGLGGGRRPAVVHDIPAPVPYEGRLARALHRAQDHAPAAHRRPAAPVHAARAEAEQSARLDHPLTRAAVRDLRPYVRGPRPPLRALGRRRRQRQPAGDEAGHGAVADHGAHRLGPSLIGDGPPARAVDRQPVAVEPQRAGGPAALEPGHLDLQRHVGRAPVVGQGLDEGPGDRPAVVGGEAQVGPGEAGLFADDIAAESAHRAGDVHGGVEGDRRPHQSIDPELVRGTASAGRSAPRVARRVKWKPAPGAGGKRRKARGPCR